VAPTIRPAVSTDQRTIRVLVRSAGINPMNLAWPNFLVAEEDGAIVGIGQVKSHGDGSRELASMVVVPERQGAGIGGAIVSALRERHGGGVLHLTCRRELRGYYARFGFEALARRDWPPYFARMLPVVNFFVRMRGSEIIVMRRQPVAHASR